jgi:hypothetical protein
MLLRPVVVTAPGDSGAAANSPNGVDRYTVQSPLLLVSTFALAACACAAERTVDGSSPEAILARAVEQAGGAAALRRARALEWDGEATVHIGGRDIRIAGLWRVQPPDSAVVTTYDITRGPSSARSLVVAAPRGWLVHDGRMTAMPPSLLASERAEFYLYELLRLVPLQSHGVTLTAAPPDSLGHRGIRAAQPGRPPATLYVDDEGRLAHVRLQVPDAETSKLEWQDAWLTNVVEASGIRWPRELHLTVDGAPFFDLSVSALRVRERLADTLLNGPGRSSAGN